MISGAAAMAAFAAHKAKAQTFQGAGLCNPGQSCMLDGGLYNPSSLFVLDQLSAFPAEGLSVRQLTANPLYARPYCMLVRRASDNATLNIGYVNGVLDVVSLLAFVGSGNGFVVTWYNQGSLGSAGDATQSTAANQPQIVASGVVETQNGVPAIYFSSTSSVLQTVGAVQTVSGNGQYTLNAVVNFTSKSANQLILASQISGPGNQLYQMRLTMGGNLQAIAFDPSGNAYAAQSSSTPTGTFIYTVNQNNLNVINYLNGTSAGQGSTVSPMQSNPAALAVGGAALGQGSGFQSYISQAIVFASVLSSQDRQILETNEAASFGISGVTQ